MLTFISFWRAAAVILNDLGSSAYYAGAIAEKAIGPSAPWFVLAVMLFSFAVRAVYVESCSMFVRGGVYRIVKEALGGTLAKMAVSALMFDYILTGPVSGVAAGQYIVGLINELSKAAVTHGWMPHALQTMFGGRDLLLPEAGTAVVIAVAVTLFYWWENIKGIEESSDKALKVMQVVTVMVVILLGWSALTLLQHPKPLPPLPIPRNLNFTAESLGFLKGSSWWRLFGLFGVMMAFGHSVLAMSGEESLAQVYREIKTPKLKNLKRTALIIAVYSFLFTGLSSLFAVMLIPDDVRISQYFDNMLAGLAMYLSGPLIARLIFRAFIVVVGFLMLSGAINTAIVGSNGVLNRVSEDGVLTDWFRRPHHKYGTSSRIINLVVGLQIVIIIASRGDVYMLGEAYAFGLMWSFVFNSLSMLVLRFKYKGERGWKVPPNPVIAGREIPIGLASVHLVLLTTAIVNLFTKSIATVAGLIFAATFFAIFTVSERINRRKFRDVEQQMKEHFQLLQSDNVESESVGSRPGNMLVSVRDYNALHHLRWALERTNTEDQDVIVMTARLTGAGSGEYDLAMEQIFSEYEQTLFTRAVSVAESYGKRISLLVVPARDVWAAIVQTANALESAGVVAGLSTKMTAEEQAFYLGRAWEAMPEPKRQFVLHVASAEGEVSTFRIGPHTPTMKSEDVHLVHRLWLDLTKQRGLDKIHHSDIVTLALTRLARDYGGRDREDILRALNTVRLAEERRNSGLAAPGRAPEWRSSDDDQPPPAPPIVGP